MQRTDRWLGAVIIALGVAVYVSSRSFPNVPGQKLGASTLPGIVAAGLALCGLLLMMRSLRRSAYPAVAPEVVAERRAPALGILAAIGLYLIASDTLGYLLTAPLCLLMAMRALSVGWRRALPASLIAALAVHVAFYKLLKVPLPWGVFPVLY